MDQPGALHDYEIVDGDELRLERIVDTGGENACFVTPHGNGALVANYMDDRLAYLRRGSAEIGFSSKVRVTPAPDQI